MKKSIKTLGILFGIFILLSFTPPIYKRYNVEERLNLEQQSNETKKDGIQFVQLGYEAALKLAKDSKKPVFIDCYTVWCGPCKILAAKTFTDKEVGDFFNSNFVNIKVEMEKDSDGSELARLFDVRAYPTLLFVNKQGKLIKKSLGYVSPSQLLDIAKEVIK